MKKLLVLITLMALPWAAIAQENHQSGSTVESVSVAGKKISISAKGLDVRSVLYDLFKQTGKNFVIDQGVRYVLYLNLTDVEFTEALHVVLKQADLGYETKNDIFYIGNNRPKTYKLPIESKTAPALPTHEGKAPTTPPAQHKPTGEKPAEHKPTGQKTEEKKPVESKPAVPPQKKLSLQDLQRRLTTRMSMADIRSVFEEFGKQTKIKIEIDPAVPYYKIDAFLIDTSLKYALDVVTDAAKLKYTLTETGTIRIEKVAE